MKALIKTREELEAIGFKKNGGGKFLARETESGSYHYSPFLNQLGEIIECELNIDHDVDDNDNLYFNNISDEFHKDCIKRFIDEESNTIDDKKYTEVINEKIENGELSINEEAVKTFIDNMPKQKEETITIPKKLYDVLLELVVR